jgi:hypothetical protein
MDALISVGYACVICMIYATVDKPFLNAICQTPALEILMYFLICAMLQHIVRIERTGRRSMRSNKHIYKASVAIYPLWPIFIASTPCVAK